MRNILKIIIQKLKRLYKKYKLSRETQKQKYYRNLFSKNIDQKGHLVFELYTDGTLRKGSEQDYGFGLDELVNPNYDRWSLVKEIYNLYIDSYGGSDLASSSSHYNNNLHVMAAMSSGISYKQMERWNKQWEEENKDRFKLKCQR